MRGGLDGWELALDELAEEPERFLSRLGRLGEVTGEMHTVLASEPNDPAFCSESPSVEALGLLTATVDEEIARVFVSSRRPRTLLTWPAASVMRLIKSACRGQ